MMKTAARVGVNSKEKVKKKIEASFRVEEYFHEIADNMDEVFFLATKKYEVLYVNPAYEKISGASLDSIKKNPESWADSMLPEDRIKFFIFAEEHIKNGENGSIEYHIKRPDGAIRLIHMRVVIIKDEHGSVYRFAGIASDVTEARLAEETLTKLKRAVDASGDVIIMTDINGLITFVNIEFTNLYGYAARDVIGKTTPRVLKSGLVKPEQYAAFWKTILAKGTVKGEIPNKTRDGRLIIVEETVTPALGEHGEILGFLSIQRDLTERKLAEKTLKASEDLTIKLENELKLNKAKEEFVSLAAHQLSSPLVAIKDYVELMFENMAAESMTEKQKHILLQISHADTRMIDLVNAFLNVSRVELGIFSIVPSPTTIGEIVEAQLDELSPTIQEKKLAIIKNMDVGSQKFNLDPGLTSIIFQNIISNAVKYTPAGGTITIAAGTDQSDIKITVSDTGIGIPKEQQQMIFSKLFRADNARLAVSDGTGLGLYLVKAIVESSGGKIWFDSEKDKGTTFFITIPLGGMKKREGTKGLI